jgi:predicted Zn-dependent peptidase
MSSRLFQEVREKRGLAYAVYSYHQGYSDVGAIKTYVGSTTGNVEEAVKVIVEQLGRVRTSRSRPRSWSGPSSSSRARPCSPWRAPPRG